MKIVFVGYFSYATNYNRDLVVAFKNVSKKTDKLFLCGRFDEKVSDGKLPQVDPVWRKDLRYILDISKYVKQHDPDVVYLHQEFKTYGGILTALSFPFLILILRLCGYKVVPTIHAVISSKQIGSDFLRSFALKNTHFSRAATNLFLKYTYFLSGNLSSAVTVHTQVLKDILVNEYKVNPDKVKVINSGVREISNPSLKPENPEILKRFPYLKNKTILLIFGFFSPRKGFEVMIKAFGKFLRESNMNQKYILVLAGDVTDDYKPYKKKIESLISSNRVKNNVLITGYVNGEEIDGLFRLSKIVVLPAVISFNISGSLAFALAYNKPILASDVGPLGSEIQSNSLGLTYIPGSIDSCCIKLEEILTNRKLYDQFLKNSQLIAKRRYWKIIAKQHYELFEKL